MPEIVPDTHQEGDSKPPFKPVEFARWVQRPRNLPKAPTVQPGDSALNPTGVKLPEANKVIGTDKPKRSKYKKANTANTSTPTNLKNPKEVPVAKVELSGLSNFLTWYELNSGTLDLKKLSLPTLARFGLGWYISDSLTRDEKARYSRQLESEFNRAVATQQEEDKRRAYKRLTRSGMPSKYKTAMEKLTDYYEAQ